MPLSPFRRQPEPAAAAAWFSSDAGHAVLCSEADAVRQALQERPGQACLWLAPARRAQGAEALDGQVCRLHTATGQGFDGSLRCGLPLALARESCGVVIVQHLADISAQPAALLEECARVLVPGGRLWLLSLNPLAPYRLRWRGAGPRAAEPVTWRRRLRAAGLVPEPVSQGLGPSWAMHPASGLQDGAGLRAAFLLRAEKRRMPLTPIRARPTVRWQPGIPAA
ncbi:MAG: methyltransferase domain-containing protein [Pseudomonadota bacterium]